jgi:vWA-MoxR associated protein C-terminal domain
MIDWQAYNQGIFKRALIESYTSNSKLRNFIRDNLRVEGLDQCLIQLPNYETTDRDDWTARLLEELQTRGWINGLYQTFCSTHQNGLQVSALKRDLGDLEGNIGEPSMSNTVSRQEIPRGLAEDPRSTHLVVAVFLQTSGKLRVLPKFCYRDADSHQILSESLAEDNPSVDLQEFPKFLKKLITRIQEEMIPKYFPEHNNQWRLTIELFIPVELLSQPLVTWCGQVVDTDIFSIVVGCSDRFNPTLANALTFRKKLQEGWERFQNRVPDTNRYPLTNLHWLTCDQANTQIFEDYSGFKCYGNWLKSDLHSLKNWQELVRSGIPLALWICAGTADQAQTDQTFTDLIGHTRFDFLNRIHAVRNRDRRVHGHCVGVFYEDPNYVPDDPLSQVERQLGLPKA